MTDPAASGATDPVADAATLRRRSLPSPTGGPSTRSMLLTVLGEFVLDLGEPVWSATLVDALGALGVQEKTARQAMARSSADGWLSRERVGRRARWSLTAPTERLLRDGAARIYSFAALTPDWDGRWLLVRISIPEDQRDHRHHTQSRLAWAGFASIGQGLWASPHPDRRAELLAAVDEGDVPVQPMVFVTEPRDHDSDRVLVDEAWGDRAALQVAYKEFMADVEGVGTAPLEPRSAFIAQTRMVHSWRKFPFLDPGLPEALVPHDWIGRRAANLFADRHTRWAVPARKWFAARNSDG